MILLVVYLSSNFFFFFCGERHRYYIEQVTKRPSEETKKITAQPLSNSTTPETTQRCRWRAAAQTPHDALDQEHPRASGKSPNTDPVGSTPEAAVVVTPMRIRISRKILKHRTRRPTESSDGEVKPGRSPDLQVRRRR
jgi:hypothetical protein